MAKALKNRARRTQAQVRRLVRELHAVRAQTLQEIERFDLELLHRAYRDPQFGQLTIWDLLQQIRDFELFQLGQLCYINACLNPKGKKNQRRKRSSRHQEKLSKT
jgi:hypothetical protein